MLKSILAGTALALVMAATPAVTQPAPATPGPDMPATTPAPVTPAPETPVTPAPEAATPPATPVTPAPAEPTTPATGAPVTPDTVAPEGADATVADGIFVAAPEQGEMRASALIGMEVINGEGESLGEINDVILDEAGQVRVFIIGVGGFLGLGERDIGVAYDAVEQTFDADGALILTLNVTREQLEAAPEYGVEAEEEAADAADAPAANTPAPAGEPPALGEPPAAALGLQNPLATETPAAAETPAVTPAP